jgi:hypothetical protein
VLWTILEPEVRDEVLPSVVGIGGRMAESLDNDDADGYEAEVVVSAKRMKASPSILLLAMRLCRDPKQRSKGLKKLSETDFCV